MPSTRKAQQAVSETEQYPERPPFYALRLLRIMAKCCAAQRIGAEACWLVSVIALLEDRTGYRRPITFYNEQLAPICGFSVDRLERARTKAANDGWLHYRRGAKGRAAEYWASIPPDLEAMTDAPIDEAADGFIRDLRRNPPEGPDILPRFAEESPARSEHSSAVCGGIPEESPKNPRNYLPNTNTKNSSCPKSGDSDEATGGNGRAKPAPSDRDIATASWIWEAIHDLQPTRKAPDLAKWANIIRLMRARDGRADEAIRQTFTAANRDSFWRNNILSPDTLRAKYDDLRLKLGLDRPGRNGKAAPLIDQHTQRQLDEIDRIKALRR